MTAVIDANIALALVLDLAYSEQARKAVAATDSMIAPDLIIHESANALWKIAKASPALQPRCRTLISVIPSLLEEIVPALSIVEEALDLALALNHPAYDCFYIALARNRGAQLITADRKLVLAAERADRSIRTIQIEP